jgi:hypothetical protein
MILASTANIAALADSAQVHKLIGTIMATIGQAKAVDDAKRELPPGQPPHALLPPRPKEQATPPSKARSAASKGDLDDDIPF